MLTLIESPHTSGGVGGSGSRKSTSSLPKRRPSSGGHHNNPNLIVGQMMGRTSQPAEDVSVLLPDVDVDQNPAARSHHAFLEGKDYDFDDDVRCFGIRNLLGSRN